MNLTEVIEDSEGDIEEIFRDKLIEEISKGTFTEEISKDKVKEEIFRGKMTKMFSSETGEAEAAFKIIKTVILKWLVRIHATMDAAIIGAISIMEVMSLTVKCVGTIAQVTAEALEEVTEVVAKMSLNPKNKN